MRAAVFNGPHSIEIAERPDPTIQSPTDAIVRVTLGCVCGSDSSGTTAETLRTRSVRSGTSSSASWRRSGRRCVGSRGETWSWHRSRTATALVPTVSRA